MHLTRVTTCPRFRPWFERKFPGFFASSRVRGGLESHRKDAKTRRPAKADSCCGWTVRELSVMGDNASHSRHGSQVHSPILKIQSDMKTSEASDDRHLTPNPDALICCHKMQAVEAGSSHNELVGRIVMEVRSEPDALRCNACRQWQYNNQGMALYLLEPSAKRFPDFDATVRRQHCHLPERDRADRDGLAPVLQISAHSHPSRIGRDRNLEIVDLTPISAALRLQPADSNGIKTIAGPEIRIK